MSVESPKAQQPAPGKVGNHFHASAPQGWADRWAIGLSLLCLIHCLAIPVSLMIMPLLAHDLISHQSTLHWLLLVLAVPLSAFALWTGYRRHHFWPILGVGALGLGAMFVGVSHLAGLQLELPLSVAGAMCLVYAHIENMRRNHA